MFILLASQRFFIWIRSLILSLKKLESYATTLYLQESTFYGRFGRMAVGFLAIVLKSWLVV